MIIKNMGSALRFCIPQSIGKKLGEFWELIKPLVDFKYEVVKDDNLLCVSGKIPRVTKDYLF